MSTHIISLGKRKFVCGLFWQSLSRPRELAKEAADLAKKIDCDLVVLRREYSTAQAGFAQSTPGPRHVLYSLAAAVASKLARDGANYDGENQPVHNWLAAFRLPDERWAYFAVRDANFLPNGDFSGTKEEVFERLHGDYGLGGWNLVIGDAELENYGFHNFREKSIEDVLGQVNGGPIKVQQAWLLRPSTARVSSKQLAIGAACGVAILVAAGFGWKQYQAYKERERQAEEAELLRQVLLRRGAAAAIPHPWAGVPLPLSMAQACVDRLTHLTAGGWALTDYGCSRSEVHYAWTRLESTVDFLLAQVPKALVDLNGNSATYTVPLTLRAGGDEGLLAASALLPSLQSRLQLMNLNLKLVRQETPAPAAPQAGGEKNGTVKANWNTYTYAINSAGLSPLEIADILSKPGIRLDKLMFHGGFWSMEGVIYAK
ncbi:hypothetical protein AAKU55_003592 [Oxalobacteraceae bacterium GrIS 1.11]